MGTGRGGDQVQVLVGTKLCTYKKNDSFVTDDWSISVFLLRSII